MSVREIVNKQPALFGAAAIGIAAVTLTFFGWRAFGHRSAAPEMAFFSDDDGQTWFVDAATNVPPFDHDGKPACRAHVYRCGEGPPFVGYLERYDMDAIAKAERAKTEALKQGPAWGGHTELADFLQLKRPGEKKWTSASDPAIIARITQPVCPDGKSAALRPVLPGE